MNEKPFEFRLVNGLQGDPAVLVQLRQSGEAILFDLGSIDVLTQKEVLRIKQVFVSHAHMDHFVGFDRLLRINVPHSRLLQVFGPPDFIERVRAKLRSYTWNLISADQIRFEVFEVHPDQRVFTALLSNTDDFSGQAVLNLANSQRLSTLSDGSQISAVLLDHKGIWSVAYRLCTAPVVKVRLERLKDLGLRPGPWLGELQQDQRTNQMTGSTTIEGKTFIKSELATEILQTLQGRSLVYLTDLAFHAANLAALQKEFGSATDGVIESSFADSDFRRALDKAHLSTRQSALIARILGLQNYSVFHISGIYGQGPEVIVEEALAMFQSLPGPGPELEKILAEELTRV